jgi:hypothetical protein
MTAGASLAWKVLATGSALVAGLAAKKILETAWTKSTGRPPPRNPESPETTWVEAVGWAVVSGVVYGIARMIATREAAAYYKRSTGHLPEAMEEAGA